MQYCDAIQDTYNKYIYKVPDILVLDKVQRQSFMLWKLLDNEDFTMDKVKISRTSWFQMEQYQTAAQPPNSGSEF